VDISECEVSLFSSDEWENGGIAQIIITNTSESAIEDWMIEFDSELDIVELWGGAIESHEGNHYFIRNPEYAQNIDIGGSWTIGFLCDTGAPYIQNVTVTQVLASDNVDVWNRIKKPDPSPFIIHMDTTSSEYTEDIGEVYFKDIEYDEELTLNCEGLLCVKDQLLLTVNEGVTKDILEAQINMFDFRIVGAIELTGDYQIESIYELNNEELNSAFLAFSTSELVDHVSYNYVSVTSNCFNSSDKTDECSFFDWGDEWNTDNPSGNNWGIEAIDFEGALINAEIIRDESCTSDDVDTSRLKTVRIGLIDEGVDDNHEDLEYKKCWNNIPSNHGTHVSGIIAAGFNNGVGISGISIKSDLYSFSLNGSKDIYKKGDGSFDISTITYQQMAESIHHLFKVKCGFALLIGNNVKVINYSQANYNDKAAIFRGNDVADCLNCSNVLLGFQKRSLEIEDLLLRLLDKGYDFLIVSCAGNGNWDVDETNYSPYTWLYSKDLELAIGNGFYCAELYGYNAAWLDNYKFLCSDGHTYKNMYKDEDGAYAFYEFKNFGLRDADAMYNNELNYSSRLRDHIVCVGALKYKVIRNGENTVGISLNQCPFSERGSRVDILAPGKGIFSSVIGGYMEMDGTSQAAPYVAGCAGLVYSLYPELKATEIKNYIVNSYSQRVDGIPVLNVAKVIETISNNYANNYNEIHGNADGFIMGVVYYNTGKLDSSGQLIKEFVDNAEVQVYSNGNYLTSVYTDSEGNYEVILPSGKYDLKFLWNDVYEEANIENLKVVNYEITRSEDVVLEKKQNVGVLALCVTDVNNVPISGADVLVCHMDDVGKMTMSFILLYEAVDPYTFCKKVKTDINGKVICALEPGCYFLLVDYNNTAGKIASVGWYQSNRGIFHGGIEAGKEYLLDIKLEPYSNDTIQRVRFKVEDENGNYIDYSKICLYYGWGATDFSAPVIEVNGSGGGYVRGWVDFDVPQGAYTAKIEKEGYFTRYMDIQVVAGGKDYLVIMEKE
ncbi:MAG: S8 family serine peptidase, partial [Lachnospiraceae bacterium]|nr:S8 family serine peptidase [Lachnospiraceae bacterium]